MQLHRFYEFYLLQGLAVVHNQGISCCVHNWIAKADNKNTVDRFTACSNAQNLGNQSIEVKACVSHQQGKILVSSHVCQCDARALIGYL